MKPSGQFQLVAFLYVVCVCVCVRVCVCVCACAPVCICVCLRGRVFGVYVVCIHAVCVPLVDYSVRHRRGLQSGYHILTNMKKSTFHGKTNTRVFYSQQLSWPR